MCLKVEVILQSWEKRWTSLLLLSQLFLENDFS